MLLILIWVGLDVFDYGVLVICVCYDWHLAVVLTCVVVAWVDFGLQLLLLL